MLSVARLATGVIGNFRPNDYYEITVVGTQETTIDLDVSFGSATLYLYNSSGALVADNYISAQIGSDTSIVGVLTPGVYYVEVSASTNTAYTLSAYSGYPATGNGSRDAGGNTLTAATSLGVLPAGATVLADYVGGSDPADYYSFNLSSAADVAVTLSGLTNYATVYLLNAAGQTLDYAYGSANSLAQFTEALPPLSAGTYYLEVTPSSTSYPTGYNLAVNVSPTNHVSGASFASAYAFGQLSTAAKTVSDSLDSNVQTETFSFTLGAASAVSVYLLGVTQNTTVSLYNAAGNNLNVNETASGVSNVEFSVDLAALASGTYYLSVNASTYTPFTLAVAATALYPVGSAASPFLITPTAAHNSLCLYASINPVLTTDYYSFSLTGSSTVNFQIQSAGVPSLAPVIMKLTNSSGATTYFTDYTDSTSDGNAPISVTLGAGSYTLSVSDYGSDSATYIMTYWTGAPAVGTSSTNNAGTSLATARNIGTPSAAGDSYADWVGPADPDDYYKFTLTSASLVSLSLTGQSTNYLLLKLLNVAGSQIANSYETAVSGGGILTYLAAGTYFIDVNSDNDTSGYSLLAQSTALPNQAGSGLGSALNIGALSTTVSYNDFVGSVDTDDYYEFTIGSPSSLSVTLSNLSENTELILRDVSGNSLAYTYGAFQSASTYGAFQSNASLIADLAAGTYFIDVNSDGYTGTTYTISLNATAFADTGGPTISSAAPLGAALGTTPLADGFSSPSQSNLLLQNASTGAIDILSVALGSRGDRRPLPRRSGVHLACGRVGRSEWRRTAGYPAAGR